MIYNSNYVIRLSKKKNTHTQILITTRRCQIILERTGWVDNVTQDLITLEIDNCK